MAADSGGSKFDLPEEVVQVLPSDPFAQLDVARKITSIALSTRVNALESESSSLRAKIAEKDKLIAELQSQVEFLDTTLSDIADKLVSAEQDKVPTPNQPYNQIYLSLSLSYLFIYLLVLETIGELGQGECFAFQHRQKAQSRCLQGPFYQDFL